VRRGRPQCGRWGRYGSICKAFCFAISGSTATLAPELCGLSALADDCAVSASHSGPAPHAHAAVASRARAGRRLINRVRRARAAAYSSSNGQKCRAAWLPGKGRYASCRRSIAVRGAPAPLRPSPDRFRLGLPSPWFLTLHLPRAVLRPPCLNSCMTRSTVLRRTEV
jgi:hypothetical protein